MKRLISNLLAASLGALLFAPTASADFGINGFDVTFTGPDGSPVTQAGSHPFAMRTAFNINSTIDPELGEVPEGSTKDLTVELPAGLVGSPTSTPRCSGADFADIPPFPKLPACSNSTVVGVVAVRIKLLEEVSYFGAPVYNLEPPPGVAAKLGFVVLGAPVTIEAGINPEPPHNIVASLTNTTQAVAFYGSVLTIWGNPADPAHDTERGSCVDVSQRSATPTIISTGSCTVSIANKPFLTMPRSCTGPLLTRFEADSWQNPGVFFEESVETHDQAEPPSPLGLHGCSKLGFGPSIAAQPTTRAAQSPTGLDFSLDVKDEGLTNPTGLAASDIRKAVVTLPEGFTTNPSLAEGLNVCTEAQLERETAFSEAGAGCPGASKIGTVEVETPLLEGELLKGALFIAKPYENEFNSLLALYIVIKSEKLGIVVKQAAKVTPDPVTGQLVTTTEDMPQLPFSHFRLHFREGARSPLATPLGCGVYDGHDPAHEPIKAELTPSSGGAPITTTSAFSIIVGPNEGPCPSGGLPPFHPGLIAGTLNNAAGRFSPFNVRLFRSDSEQEITHFSIKLPPGVVGKLAGIPFCSDAAIEAAKARTGPHGGQEEIEAPSCPAASEVGHTLAGAGVGPSLAYAPGKLYLAGPYHGSAISLVSVTAGKVGPFDLGTVVVQLGFKINPETAEVFIDATGSDPIPHIIKGIPVHLRDIRAYTDRPEFVLNPTSCARTSTASTVLGSGLDFASEADDNPVTVSTPFQAADCASLGFKPRLALRLRGGTKRGDHPALRAVLRPRAGDANSRSVSVQLPHSAFLEQGHIKTICTRVQFKEGAGNGAACPAGSVYGHARAFSPLFSDPLEGPVFLRSSEHELPDLVLALHGLIDFDAVGRIDSVDGGIRNTFDFVPDAPVSEVVVNFQGGKKGLIVNSTDLCRTRHRAIVKFAGHNGKAHNAKPLLRAKCGGKGKRNHKGRQGKGK